MSQKTILKKKYDFDPRVRLTIVLCLSTLSVCITDLKWLVGLFLLTCLVALFFGGYFWSVLKKFRWIIYMFFTLTLAQSLFGHSETVLLHLGSIKLLTAEGLVAAGSFALRIFIVVLSASILLRESTRRMIQALSQMHCPYELAFMTATAVRFMGVMKEEFSNSMHAIQLRGVDLKKVPLRKRMGVYTYLFLPVMSGAIFRARQLSLSLDLRGFRKTKERSSYFYLSLAKKDILIIVMSLLIFIIVMLCYFVR